MSSFRRGETRRRECAQQRQLVGGRGARRAHGGHDPASRGVQLFVRGAAGAQRELLDAVAEKARVRVAIHQPRECAQSASVELLDLAGERRQVAHAADRLDRTAGAENVRVLQHVDLAERGSAQWRLGAGRRRQLSEVADEQAPGVARRAHSSLEGGIGASRPCASAAAAASG